MKVLLCGEYGLFCTDLISRLKKEKHDVFVITGSEKIRRQKPGTGVFQEYHFSYRSKNVRTIMKNIQPDIMIILGVCDTKYTWLDENHESVKYLTGITNLLMGAKEAGIKQILYCSSLGVYEGCTDLILDKSTPFKGDSLLMQTMIQTEHMCREQNEPGKFDISVIRYPEVYGDYKTHEYNICTRMMRDFWHKTKVTIEPSRQHRVLYVKDAVDTLMRVFACQKREESYLVLGSTYSERQILDEIRFVIQGREVEVEELEDEAKGLPDISDSQNHSLPFNEKYSLEDGMKELYKLFEKENDLEAQGEKKKSIIREIIFPLVENIGLFLFITVLTILLRDTWFASIINFYLFYVLIVSVVYGCAHALFATFLTLVAQTAQIFFAGTAFAYTIFTDILPILVIGVLVGYMRDKYKRKNDDLEDEKKYYQSELVDMTRIYDGNRFVKELYEKRLMNYENSMVKVYEVTSRLDFWEPQKVIFQAVDVASELLGIEDVAIYIVGSNSSYVRLAASSSKAAQIMGKSIQVNEEFFMHQALVERNVYRNKEIETKFPSYACGIYHEESLNAVIMMWTKQLTKINLYEANMLALICRLIGTSMDRATTFWNMNTDQYIPGTSILEEDAFQKIEQVYIEGAQQNKLEYAMLKVPQAILHVPGQNWHEQVEGLIRQTDIIGQVEGDIFIILPNTNQEEAAYVTQRFHNAKLQVENVISCMSSQRPMTIQ